MADYLYKIEYDDFNGTQTTIKWFKKGVTGALSDYTFTGTGEPLTRKGYCDDRYSTLRGQEVNFSFYIKTQADEDELRKLLRNKWYVTIEKEGSGDIWFGEISQFYDEAYTTFPYPVKVTATDRLGLLKDDKILKIDYPTPPIPFYSLIEFVVNILDFRDGTTYYDHCPTNIRVDHHLYVTNEGKLLEELYLDPLVFMDDEDQYCSKWDALDSILKTLGMKLIQWGGIWYLIGLTVQEEVVGKIQYIEYDFATLTGGTRTDETLTMDLYANKTNTPVNNDMLLTFEPSWKGLVLNKKYVVNTNIIPSYANRSGSNYIGHNNIYLEFNAGGSLHRWADFGYAVRPNKENDGWAKGWARYRTHLNYKYKSFQLPQINFDSFEFNVSLIDSTEWLLIYPFQVRISDGSTTYYLHDKNTNEYVTGTEPDYEWATSEETLYIHKRGTGRIDYNFQIQRPGFDYTGINTIEVRFYNAYQNSFSTPHPVNVFMRHLRLRCVSNEWELQDYEVRDDDYLDFLPDNKIDNVEIDLNWGMYEPGFVNDHAYSLSHPMDADGNVIETVNSEWLVYNTDTLTLPLALKSMMLRDNVSLSRKLTGTVRSFTLTPLTLVKDTEGYYYHILDWEYNDRTGYWKINTIECKNYQAAANAGDYDTADYNDDYYK